MIKTGEAIKPQTTSSLLSRGAAGGQAVSARHSGFRSLAAAGLPKTRDVGQRPMDTSNQRSLLDAKTQKNRPDSAKGSRAGFFGKRDYRAFDSPSSNLRSIASISSMLWSTSTLGFLRIAECDATGGTGAMAGPSGIEGADGGPWHAAHIRSAT
jgi:hypothetical protein